MREIGKVIERELPAGYGFCLHTFPMNDKGGRIDYISNANREDMIEVLQMWVQDKLDDYPTPESN